MEILIDPDPFADAIIMFHPGEGRVREEERRRGERREEEGRQETAMWGTAMNLGHFS